ncbi:MAG: nucleoside-diphosphate sugar epimerase/dehydratase [Candidatus Promineifilaceae bacterium]
MSIFNRLRNRHFFLFDVLLLPLAVYASYVLRLETFALRPEQTRGMLFYALVLTAVIIITFWYTGIYARYWRYASLEEMLLLAGTVTASTFLASGITFAIVHVLPIFWSVPRSVPLISLLIGLAVTSFPRLTVRMLAMYHRRGEFGLNMRRVLVVGAGDAGSMIVREMQQNPRLRMQPIAFVDDDRQKHGVQIHSVVVSGGRDKIPELVNRHDIEEIIIALPSAPGKVVREIVRVCEQCQVKTRIIPGMYELLDGRVSVSQLRHVEVEDLLRREPVQTDVTAVQEMLRDKRVLITGGGGSIGSELCRQVMRARPKQIVVVGHGENSVFLIHQELRKLAGENGPEIVPIIADIRFADRLQYIFNQYRPQVVFHAAAHKHVPLMEANPSEAITNNVLGTRNLLKAAQATNVERFVMISTDKAVNPTSIMGASKRAAELLVHQAAQATKRPYVAVRFGNVLGSQGSVVLTFRQQIANGGPVTVTHPEMKRFFMTIPEAVQLVLQAATLGQGGEVFILDMGEPVKIVDLARDLIQLSGLEVGRDIDIIFTGMRPGEKLFEELFVSGETYKRTAHEKIFLAADASHLVPDKLDGSIDDLIAAAQRNEAAGIYQTLRTLIPEFLAVRDSVVGKGKDDKGEEDVPSAVLKAKPSYV